VEWWLLHLIITRECLQSLNDDLDARVILEIFGHRHILLHHCPASAWRNWNILLRLSELTSISLSLSHVPGSCRKILCYIIWCFSDRTSQYRLVSNTNFNAQFLYSITICMLHYNPRHVSSINMPIFRRTNCIITVSGIVTLCKRLCREWRYQMLR
jgi:hypothetical protein